MPDATLRFELFSRDVAAARAFLEGALGFVATREDGGYAEMSLGAVRIGLADARTLPPEHPLKPTSQDELLGRGVEIVIETDDVETAYVRAAASGSAIGVPLARRPWGLTDFRLLSPDGYYLRVPRGASLPPRG